MGGDVQALANLGYCYFYGRACEKNYDLAFAYFKMAAYQRNVDALYKLSNMYASGIGVEKDEDIADYYLRAALDELNGLSVQVAKEYPSVFYSAAKSSLKSKSKNVNLENVYELLKFAKEGYEMMIAQGDKYYEKMLMEVIDILHQKRFQPYWDEEDVPIIN